MKILIVENHPDTLDCLKVFCQDRGHEVRTAVTLAEARRELVAEAPNLLLCDIGLPDGAGWDLFRQAELPAWVFPVAMSGFGMRADGSRSREAGFRGHLLKPFKVAELESILKEAEAGAR